MKDKKVILNANSCRYLLNFRKSSIKALTSKGYKVYCLAPADESSGELARICTKFIPISYNKSSKNPLNELKILISFLWIFLRLNPTVIFNFTIKNNIYGSLASFLTGKKVVNNITGLGSAMLKPSITRKIILLLYKIIKNIPHHTFCQNSDDLKYLKDKRLVNSSKVSLLPGSGVDTAFFHPKYKSVDGKSFTFIFVGRIIKDKGFIELIYAFKKLLNDLPEAKLEIVGSIDLSNPSGLTNSEVKELCNNKNIILHGQQKNVREFLSKANCFVLPSYREGLPRSMLEAMAMEIPVIATNVPGSRELIVDDHNGLLCEPFSEQSLYKVMKKMINLDDDVKIKFSKKSRELVCKNFEEKIVIDELLSLV
tara:strand:- start:4074 stop:5177 length:1104 start_codon:yes stop_codon:yes gene_type:complete